MRTDDKAHSERLVFAAKGLIRFCECILVMAAFHYASVEAGNVVLYVLFMIAAAGLVMYFYGLFVPFLSTMPWGVFTLRYRRVLVVLVVVSFLLCFVVASLVIETTKALAAQNSDDCPTDVEQAPPTSTLA